jgi:hypothetical protein
MKAEALRDLEKLERSFKEYAAWSGPNAWRNISWALVFKGWAERLAAIRAELGGDKPGPPAPIRPPNCKCTFRQYMVGDGCDQCNPELAKELAAPICAECGFAKETHNREVYDTACDFYTPTSTRCERNAKSPGWGLTYSDTHGIIRV